MGEPVPSPAGHIRRATMDDVPALERLVERSIRALSAGHYDAAQVESSLRHLYGIDTVLVQDGTYLVMEMEGALAGCGGWSFRQTPFGGDNAEAVRDDAGRRIPGRDAAVMRAYFVDPAWTRRGIARKLLTACEAAAREAGFDRFELTSTSMGRAMYAACGYRAVEPVDVALPDGQHLPHVLMVKP